MLCLRPRAANIAVWQSACQLAAGSAAGSQLPAVESQTGRRGCDDPPWCSAPALFVLYRYRLWEVIVPNRPSTFPLGLAVKYSVSELDFAPPPKVRIHSPSMTRGLPSALKLIKGMPF